MSSPVETHIFLPAYLLESVIDDEGIRRVDSNLFLSTATASQILGVILAFYPHFNFDETVKEDVLVLKRIYFEMVARRLHNIHIPDSQHYLHVKLDYLLFGHQDSHTTITSGTVLNAERISEFNHSVLLYLRNGQYHVAAEKLIDFVQTYDYLNKDEIANIQDAHEDTVDTIHDRLDSLQDAHQSIEQIQLSLSESGISEQERLDLETRLKSALILLKSRQTMFDHAVKNGGYVKALVEHYQKLFDKKSAIPSDQDDLKDNVEPTNVDQKKEGMLEEDLSRILSTFHHIHDKFTALCEKVEQQDCHVSQSELLKVRETRHQLHELRLKLDSWKEKVFYIEIDHINNSNNDSHEDQSF